MKYLALWLLLSFPLQAISEQLLVLGDSLSAAYRLPEEQGWVSLLQQRLDNASYTIYNESISGETSSGLLYRLPSYLKNRNIDYAIVEIGINDAFAHTPLDVIEENLEEILHTLKNNHCEILLIEMQLPFGSQKDYQTAFQTLYKHMAKKYDATLAPFLLRDIIHSNHYMMDQIHPNAAGQQQVLTTLWPSIQQLLQLTENR